MDCGRPDRPGRVLRLKLFLEHSTSLRRGGQHAPFLGRNLPPSHWLLSTTSNIAQPSMAVTRPHALPFRAVTPCPLLPFALPTVVAGER